MLARHELTRKVADAVASTLEAMADDELMVLIAQTQALSESNCWWLEYQLAPIIAVLAGNILIERQKAEFDRAESDEAWAYG